MAAERAATERPPLYDHGKLHASVPNYELRCPRNGDEVQAVIGEAARRSLALRVRGGGHSMSGMSLPRAGEILVRTHAIDHYRFEAPGTITVGAGALVLDVRDFVRSHGYEMPIFHGGWPGVTIGGYINAGGLGDGRSSQVHGGLWENVEEITFIDGTGRGNTVHRYNPIFPWLFGAYGQYGLLLEARLTLVSSRARHAQHSPTGRLVEYRGCRYTTRATPMPRRSQVRG